MKKVITICGITIIAISGAIQAGPMATNYFQGWENSAWTEGSPDWADGVTQCASGNNGITAASGNGYAKIDGTNGPYTKNGGYSADWGGGWKESIDIYMDITKTSDAKYSWSLTTAICKNVSGDAQHLQDNIFMVAADSVAGKFIVGARNTWEKIPDASWVKNYANGSELNLTQSGWVTFEWEYFQDGGLQKSKYNVYDALGTLLWSLDGPSHNLNDCDGLGNPIGGNRYTWFCNINDAGGNAWLAADNSSTTYVPEPATIALLGLGGLLLRRKK